MTTYVVTVPGTFLDAPTAEAREALVRALRPVDPQGTDFGEAEELDILTVYDGTTAFSLRLEVAADTRSEAEHSARVLAADALRAAGYSPRSAPLGEPVITGIDAD
jgi:LmbE family N-acetylglucosaminyl deacetylase